MTKTFTEILQKTFLKILMSQAEPHYFSDRTTESSILGY